MLKNIKKGMFPFLVGFSALSVSGSAAFYSVFGLSKLFAGASTEVIIMAGSLEIAKLVTASLLYQYWDTINKVLKYYLSVAVVILILITSMGIYGFLSSAYQDTFNQLTYVDNEKAFLQQKVDFYQQDLTRYDKEIDQILANITTLSNAKSRSIQIKDTSVVGGVRNTISTSELRLAQKRIEVEEENRKAVQVKRDVAVDSLRTYQQKILDLDNNIEVAGELGPLKYLSGLTGYPMDRIINILLLVIIFVFDPLAVALVVAANFAWFQAFPRKKYRENLYQEKVEVKDEPNVFDEYSEEDEKRMDIIGQNGNEGEHYEAPVVETLLADVEALEKEEKKEKKKKIIKDLLEDKGGWNGNVAVTPERIEEAYKKLTEDDDLTIRY